MWGTIDNNVGWDKTETFDSIVNYMRKEIPRAPRISLI
jgi:hypothetical protein